MVAIVSGNSTGLLNTSAGTLGQQGLHGSATPGASKESVYVNIATGNMTLQRQDEFLATHGSDVAVLRTYNSQGTSSQGYGNRWMLGTRKQIVDLTGTVNTAGSTVSRIDADGSISLFRFDSARVAYVSTDGGGTYQSITFDGVQEWTWHADHDARLGLYETYRASDGLIIATGDEQGTRLAYAYDTQARQYQVHSASGDNTYYEYTGDYITGIYTNLEGTLHRQTSRVSYSYDALGRLTSVKTDLTPEDKTDTQTYQTNYTYVGSGSHVETVTQDDGTSLAFTYVTHDGKLKVASVTDALGATTGFDYSLAGTTVVTDPLGSKTAYSYDAARQLLRVQGPAVGGVPQVTSFEYNSNGDVTRSIDARGLVTDYRYDANGNRVFERDAAGNTITRVYSLSSNRLLSETRYATPDLDGAGPMQPADAEVTRFVYDERNRLRFVIGAEGAVQEQRYNWHGQQEASLTYVDARVSASPSEAAYGYSAMLAWLQTPAVQVASVDRVDYLYDTRGLVYRTTSYRAVSNAGTGPVPASASIIFHFYNPAGELYKSTDANGNSSTFTYDGLGRLLSATDARGNRSETIYDDAGGRVVTGSANGLSTASVYDRGGRLLQVAQTGSAGEPLGVTRYTYDKAGRMRTLTDPRGQVSHYFYDDAGRKISEVDPEGYITGYTYDAVGNQTSSTRYATPLGQNNAPARGTTTSGIGDNLLVDPTFTNIKEGNLDWSLSNYLVDPITGTDEPQWRVENDKVYGEETYFLSTPVGYQQGAYNETRQTIGNIQAGKKYAASVYAGALSADVSIRIQWFGHNNQPLGYADDASTTESTVLADEKIGQANIDGYKRIYMVGTAPAGAAYAVLILQKAPTYQGHSSSWLFATRAQFEQLADTATAPSAWKPTIIVSAQDRTALTVFDNAGRPVKTVDALGYVTQFDYDGVSRLIRTTEFATPVSTAALGMSPAASAINPVSSSRDSISRNFYGQDGTLLATLGPQGALKRNYYDGAGRVTHTVEYATKVIGQVATGSLASLVPAATADDRHHYFYYDAQGRLTSTVDAEGYLTVYRYDAVGNQISSIRHATPLGKTGRAPVAGTTTKAIGDNRLLDPTFTHLKETGSAWSFRNWAETPASGTDEPGWCVVDDRMFGEETLFVSAGIYRAGAYSEVRQTISQIEVGKVYSASVYAAAHSATASIHIDWLDQQGNRISSTGTEEKPDAAVAHNEKIGGPAIEGLGNVGYKRIFSVGTAPAGAVSAVLVIQKAPTYLNHPGSWMFATRAQFELLGDTATVPSGWKPSAVLGANDYATYATYNNLNQIESETGPDGTRTSHTYDKAGNRTATTRAAGTLDASSANVRYDLLGRVIAELSGEGAAKMASALSTTQIDAIWNTHGVRYELDAAGNRISMTDALGQRSLYFYDAQSRLAATVSAEGEVTISTYDGLDQPALETRYRSGLSQPVRASLVGGMLSETVAALFKQLASPEGDMVTVKRYDQNGRLAWQVDALGGTTRFTYDAAGNLTSTAAFANALSPAALAALIADVSAAPVPAGPAVVHTQVYDTAGRLVFRIDPLGAVTESRYDAFDNEIETVRYANPVVLGTTSTLTGDDVKSVLQRDGARDAHVYKRYDNNGRLVWTIDPAGAATQYFYNANGNIHRKIEYATPVASASNAPVASAADRTTYLVYDVAQRVRFSVDTLGYVTETRYDPLGQVKKTLHYTGLTGLAMPAPLAVMEQAVAGKEARTASFTYDRSGRLLSSTDGVGNTEYYEYNALGQRVVFKNKAGKVWNYAYDAVGRMTKETAPDVAGLASGPAKHFSYDALGNAVKTIDAAGFTRRQVYDAAGQVAFDIDVLGQVTSYLRDAFGQVVKQTRHAVNAVPPDQLSDAEWTFAKVQARVAALIGSGDVSQYMTYDAAGRMVRSVDAAGLETYSAYDARGNLLRQDTYNSGVHGPVSVTHYVYDVNDRLIFTIDPTGGVAENRYDAVGNVIQTLRYATAIEFAGTLSDDARMLLASTDAAMLAQNTVKSSLTGSFSQLEGGETYKVSARVRQVSGDGWISLGVKSRNASGALILDGEGKPHVSLATGYHQTTIDNGWKTIEATLSGYSPAGGYDSSMFAAGSVDAAPVLFFNDAGHAGTGGQATVEIDYIKFIKVSSRTVLNNNSNMVAGVSNWTHAASAVAARDSHVLTLENVRRLLHTNTAQDAREFRSYDANGRMTWSVDPSGYATRFAYDAAGNLVQRIAYTTPLAAREMGFLVSDPGSVPDIGGPASTTQYVYDSNNRLVFTVDPVGAVTESKYDALGNVSHTVRYATQIDTTRTLTADGKVFSISADAQTLAQYPSTASLTGSFSSLEPGARYKVRARVRQVSGSGWVSLGVKTKDAAGVLITKADGQAHVPLATGYHATTLEAGWKTIEAEIFGYTAPGDYDSSKFAAGSATAAPILFVNQSATVGADGLATIEVDSIEFIRVSNSETLNNNAQMVALASWETVGGPVQATSSFVLPEAVIRSMIRPDIVRDVHEFKSYDAAGRLRWSVDPVGTATQFDYDNNDNLVKQTVYTTPVGRSEVPYLLASPGSVPAVRAGGVTTRYVYDAARRLIFTIDPLGAVSETKYDALGRVTETVRHATPVDIKALTTRDGFSLSLQAIEASLTSSYANVGGGQTYRVRARVRQISGEGSVALGVRQKDTAGALIVDGQGKPKVSIAGGYKWLTPAGGWTELEGNLSGFSPADGYNANEFAAGAASAAAFLFFPDGKAGADGQATVEVDYVEFLDEAGKPLNNNRETVAGTAAWDWTNTSVISLTSDIVTETALRAVLQVNNATDVRECHRYDQSGRPTLRIDAGGYATGYVYNAAGALVSQTAYATPMAVDAGYPASSVADRTTHYVVDASGRVRFTIDPAGYVQETQYDALGRVTRTLQYEHPVAVSMPTTQYAITLALAPIPARETGYVYDGRGQLLSTTDALSQTERYTYDALGNKKTFQNKLGKVWDYEYDLAGRLTRETAPQVSVVDASGVVTLVRLRTRTVYDVFGNVKSRTEAEGIADYERTTTYEYDLAGRQVKTILPRANVYNAALDSSPSTTSLARIETEAADRVVVVRYNALGNAIQNIDAGGNVTAKIYNSVGQVRFEIDAKGYVTGREYDAFGNVTKLTRYAASIGTSQSAALLDCAGIIALLAQQDHTDDRTLETAYDRKGNAIRVAESTSLVRDLLETAGGTVLGTAEMRKVTLTNYNAFGEAIQVQVVGEGANGTRTVASDVRTQFDRRGRSTARFNLVNTAAALAAAQQGASLIGDVGGYVTKMDYDFAGNLTDLYEYEGLFSDLQSVGAGATARHTRTEFDRLGQKKSETRFNVETASLGSNGEVVNQSTAVITRFSYDAVGNLLATTDARGGVTRSYYDSIGMVTHVTVQGPATTSSVEMANVAGAVAPALTATAFARDVYGNVVIRTEFATAAQIDANGRVVTTASAADRKTLTVFDRLGQAIQMTDAEGNSQFTSYDVFGRAAKQWQDVGARNATQIDPLTGATIGRTGDTAVAYKVMKYDSLGQLVSIKTPGDARVYAGGNITNAGAAVPVNEEASVYNAFGEVVSRSRNGVEFEYSRYDRTGGVWMTNSGDGVDKLVVHNVNGQVASQITSAALAGSGLGIRDFGSVQAGLAQFDAQQANGIASVFVRTDTRYDLMGRAINQMGAAQLVEGGEAPSTQLGLCNVTTNITSRSRMYMGKPLGVNNVEVWPSIPSGLGASEYRITIDYYVGYHVTSDGSAYSEYEYEAPSSELYFTGEVKTVSDIYNADALYTGAVNLRFEGPGCGEVREVRVEFKDITGEWRVLGNSELPQAPQFLRIASAPVPLAATVFKYTLVDGSNERELPVAAHLGDALLYDTAVLADGNYLFRAYYTDPATGTQTLYTSGAFTVSSTGTAKQVSAAGQARTPVVVRPTVYQRMDRWGNVVSITDPRSTSWSTTYKYNAGNQVVETRLSSESTSRQRNYYDELGRQIATSDAIGNVTKTVYDHNGHVGVVVNADSGRVMNVYNLFGDRVSMVETEGYATSYAYDRLGRLASTSTESVSVATANAASGNMELGYGWRQLVDRYSYNALGQRTSVTNGADETTNYWYDYDGNLIRTTDALNRTTTSRYDAFRNKIAETNGRLEGMSWQFDAHGRVRSYVDLAGAVISYTYDGMQRQRTVTSTARIHAANAQQNIEHIYEGALLKQIIDRGTATTTSYSYDLAGNRTREKTVVAPDAGREYVAQNNYIEYDQQSRLVEVADGFFDVQIGYDLNGNRTSVRTLYSNSKGVTNIIDARNKFDKMNRAVIVNGVQEGLDPDNVVIGTKGHALVYNLAGRRLSDTYLYKNATADAGSPTTETFYYDRAGRVSEVKRDNVLTDQRSYDGAGRVTSSGLQSGDAETLKRMGVAPESRTYHYDAAGQLSRMKMRALDGSLADDIYYKEIDNGYFAPNPAGYDAAGNLIGYTVVPAENGKKTYYQNTFARFDTYKEQKVTGMLADADGTVTSIFNANGYVAKIEDLSSKEGLRTRAFFNDASGRVLVRVEEDNGTGITTRTMIVNGEVMGTSSDAADPDGFANVYEASTSSMVNAAPSIYQTSALGETPTSIAKAVWGDSKLWYLISDANGLTGNETLAVHTVIKIPARGNTVYDGYASFKPYNANEALGSTTPTLPPPGAGGCGATGVIVMVAIAILVAAVASGAAYAAISNLGTLLSPGTAGLMSVSTGISTIGAGIGGVSGFGATSAFIAASAVGGAVGSAVSQAAGVAMGMQNKINWKGVAVSALSAGITAGVSEFMPKGTLETKSAWTAARAVVSSALTQGISSVTKLQGGFSWRAVASAGISAYINTELAGEKEGTFLQSLWSNFASGTFAGAVAAVATRGKVNISQVAADAFGNALGQGLADSLKSSPATPVSAMQGKFALDFAAWKRGLDGNLVADLVGGGIPADIVIDGSRSMAYAGPNSAFLSEAKPTERTRVRAYTNGYVIRDEAGTTSFTPADMLGFGAGMSFEDYSYASKRLHNLSANYDNNDLFHAIGTSVRGWFGVAPIPVRTPAMEQERWVLRHVVANYAGAHPEVWDSTFAAVDAARSGVVGAVAVAATRNSSEQDRRYAYRAASIIDSGMQAAVGMRAATQNARVLRNYGQSGSPGLEGIVVRSGQATPPSGAPVSYAPQKVTPTSVTFKINSQWQPSSEARVVTGETAATATGKAVHSRLAAERRMSGRFDLVNEPFVDGAGASIMVPRRVDLNTGLPVPGAGQQVSRPDAVRFGERVIIDDKPLGRPVSKDRQEIVRFIDAFTTSQGVPPRTIAIQRYDPHTGIPYMTELYKPSDFTPWTK